MQRLIKRDCYKQIKEIILPNDSTIKVSVVAAISVIIKLLIMIILLCLSVEQGYPR